MTPGNRLGLKGNNGGGRKPLPVTSWSGASIDRDCDENAWKYQNLLQRYNAQTPWQLIEALDNKVFELTQLRTIVKPGTEPKLKEAA